MNRCTCLLGLLVLCTWNVFAQTAAPQAKPVNDTTEPAQAKADAQRALDLLCDAGFTALTLDDRELAARLAFKAAGLVERRAPETARELAHKAYEKAVEHLQDEKPHVPPLPLNQDLYERLSLCRHIVTWAQRNDKDLGKSLAEDFELLWARVQQVKRQQGYLASLNDAYLLFPWSPMRPSGILGPQFPRGFDAPFLWDGRPWRNPDAATPQEWVNKAQQAYAASLPHNLANNLWYIADYDRAAADQLFLFVLHRIHTDETAGPVQLLQIARYPFGEHYQSISDGVTVNEEGKLIHGGISFYGRQPGPPPLLHRGALRRDEYLVYRFLQTAFVVLQRTLNNSLIELPNPASCLGAGLCLALWLEPRVTALQPKQLPALQALIATLNQRVPANQQTPIRADLAAKWGEQFDSLYRRDFPDQPLPIEAPPIDMLKSFLNRAEKSTNSNERDFFYQEAALYADRESPAEQALPLAEKIKDLEYRRAVRAWLSFNAARVALERGDYARAQKLAEDLTALDQRILILSRVAAAWMAKQRDKALGLYDDLETELHKADNDTTTLRAWLLLTNSLAGVDRQRALDALAELTRVANKLADFQLSDLRMTRTLQHPSGVVMAWPRATSETLRELDWQQPFTALARDDFEKVFGLVQAIDDRPLKVSASLAVAAQLAEKVWSSNKR